MRDVPVTVKFWILGIVLVVLFFTWFGWAICRFDKHCTDQKVEPILRYDE